MSEFKTNSMRILDSKKISYNHYEYNPEITEGTSVAKLLGQPEEKVFKTLVTVAPSKINYVFVIPVAETLDLKAAAKCVGEKSIAMIKQKELLPLTGYIHGGCSPVGMKKQFKTTVDKSAESLETICVSAGKVGHQIEVSVKDLAELVRAEFAEITVK